MNKQEKHKLIGEFMLCESELDNISSRIRIILERINKIERALLLRE